MGTATPPTDFAAEFAVHGHARRHADVEAGILAVIEGHGAGAGDEILIKINGPHPADDLKVEVQLFAVSEAAARKKARRRIVVLAGAVVRIKEVGGSTRRGRSPHHGSQP